ncbi:MAG: hypothetical protein M9962_08625 [Oligoflexia bacterium]|nr:hypothetical protein [Oligoflexia bacterium]
MRESIWMIVLFFFTLNAYSAEISSCPPIEKEKNTIAISQPVFEQFRLCKNAEQMELHAHRGAGNRPENTMAAFKEAVKQGASVIELDLQMSADKTVIINHDPELRENQCLNPDGSKQQTNYRR